MAHVEKYAMGGVAGLERHCLRRTEGHKNKDIDNTKSHLNYALDDREKPLDHFKKRMSEIRTNQRRDDIKVAASWVITQPRGLSQDESRKFFETAHNFLTKRYGENNVLWSRVHMDETTPHMHFCFMPVTRDKKHEGQEKLCAKDVLNRNELKVFHSELNAEMTRVFGRDVGIETGLTEKSLPLEKLKIQTAINETVSELDAKQKELAAVLEKRKTFVDGRKLAQKIHDEYAPGTLWDKKNVKIDEALLKEAIDYIWNSGGKDDEISKLKAELRKAVQIQEEAKKTEQQRAFLAQENTKLRSRTFDAEKKSEQLQTVLDNIKKIDPAILTRAVSLSRDRGRGGMSR